MNTLKRIGIAVLMLVASASAQLAVPVVNATSTGTTLNTLTKFTVTSSATSAVISATTDTSGVVGITAGGAGTSGTATVVIWGITPCIFDNTTTADDYVQISSGTAGNCHDAGSTRPTSGQIIGIVFGAGGSAGTYNVELDKSLYPLALAQLPAQSANTVVGNFTSGSAAPAATAVASCSGNNDAEIYTTNTGFVCGTNFAQLNVAETFTALQTFGAEASIAATAHGVLLSENTGAVVATGAGTAGQVFASGGGSADGGYIDFPERYFIPAANCNNTTAGAGWSIPSGGTVTCRAGTNNLGGYITITDTSSTFAQFMVTIPEDWDTGTRPYIRFILSAGSDTTNGHTIIPQIKVSCPTAGNGTVSDDATFSAAQSSSTITLGASAVANGFYNGSNVQIGSTQMTGCIAGGMMIVQVGRATDTGTGNINFYGATVTFPRLLTVQAN